MKMVENHSFRRQLLAVILGGWLGLVHADEEPMNVLFIAADDLRVQLGCYGSPVVQSPRIDGLAERGLLFERAYCQQTVCNPSRASVMTGVRPDTLRVWDLPTHFRENVPTIETLPQTFRRHGYFAQGVGKIFHNWVQEDWKGDPDSWSVPATLHYGRHGDDLPEFEGELPPNLASGAGGTDCRDVPDEAYYDGRVALAGIEALRACAARDQPFFLGVGFWKPHTPLNAPKRYWDLYDPATVPIPPHLTPPVDVPEIALTPFRYKNDPQGARLREMSHGYLAAISYLDTQVGKVLDELDRLGLREKTIVVFWSDHGLLLGEHGLEKKTTLFEIDAHVPLIISDPRTPGGRRAPALVELLDLFPTLVDLCGLEPPAGLQGDSLAGLLRDPAFRDHDVAITQIPRPPYPRRQAPEIMGYSMRTDRYRYTEWRDFETGTTRARELYDHAIDALETRNIAGDPALDTLILELAERLEREIPRAR